MLWHQVPAFWTTAAPAQDAEKKAGAEKYWRRGNPPGRLHSLHAIRASIVPDDAVVVREETETSRSARPRLRRSSSDPPRTSRANGLREIGKVETGRPVACFRGIVVRRLGPAHRATVASHHGDRFDAIGARAILDDSDADRRRRDPEIAPISGALVLHRHPDRGLSRPDPDHGCGRRGVWARQPRSSLPQTLAGKTVVLTGSLEALA